MAPATRATRRQVSQMLQLLVKAVRSLRLYDERHDLVRRFVGDFHTALKMLLSAEPLISLLVLPGELTWRQEVVYAGNADRDSDFGFQLYQEGFRRLQFTEPVPADEALDFIRLLANELGQGSRLEADLGTLFWEADFSGIRAEIAESFVQRDGSSSAMPETIDHETESYMSSMGAHDLPRFAMNMGQGEITDMLGDLAGGGGGDGGGGGRGMGGHDAGQNKVRRTHQQLVPYVPRVPIKEFREDRVDSYYEAAFLEAQAQTSFQEVGAILFQVLIAEPDPEAVAQMLEDLREIVGALYATGGLEAAVSLLRNMALLGRHLQARADGRGELLEQFLAGAADPTRLSALATALNESWNPELKPALFMFARLQTPSSFDALFAMMGQLDAESARQGLADGLLLLSGRDARRFAGLLRLPEPRLVAAAAYCLGRLESPQTVELLVAAGRHEEFSVRRQVLQALRKQQAASIRRLMVHTLGDQDLECRLHALRYLAVYRVAEAGPPIQALIQRSDFDRRETREQRGLLSSYARIMGAQAVPLLVQMLERGSSSQVGLEQLQVRVDALRTSGAPAAAQYLRQLYPRARGELKRSIGGAIRAIEGRA